MKTLVTAKVNPDLDGVSCTLSYADFLNKTGKTAEGIIFGTPQSEVQYFIEKHNISIQSTVDDGTGSWDKFILVDASSMLGMPKVVRLHDVIEIIDHRKGEPEKEFPQAIIQNELIGAAATLVVERYITKNLLPTLNNAKLLYGAIYHNTLNFISTNTSDRDKSAAKWIEENYGLSNDLAIEMFGYATEIICKDIKKAIKDDAKEFGGKFTVGAYQLILSGKNISDLSDDIEKSVINVISETGSDWGFINVVDIESAKSTIYCPDIKGQSLLSKALDCSFENAWSTLNKAWLRKQIVPLISG